MAIERILVCEAQVPFVTGGAEYLVRSLVKRLVEHGYQTSLVSLPFKSYPKEGIISQAAAWRLLDLTESNGESVDLLITTKFPTYFARHSNKVSWLVHQYRPAYELCGTEFSDLHHSELDVGLREQLIMLDGKMLKECRKLFTIARNTSNRLKKFNGLNSEPLYHPPRLANQLKSGGYGDYILSVGRLETIKRTDLLVKAMEWIDPPIRLVIAGEGTQRAVLEALAEKMGISHRIQFSGMVDDKELVSLYEGALCVAYVPYDEDYGYVTLEAFLSRRPVVTAVDSGGTLEFVEDGVNGFICEPSPEAIAAQINRVAENRSLAASLGTSGLERAQEITWDGVIDKLVVTS